MNLLFIVELNLLNDTEFLGGNIGEFERDNDIHHKEGVVSVYSLDVRHYLCT